MMGYKIASGLQIGDFGGWGKGISPAWNEKNNNIIITCVCIYVCERERDTHNIGLQAPTP